MRNNKTSNKNHKLSEFVFKYRMPFSIVVALGPTPFKFLFKGKTTLTLWIAGFFLMLLGITFRMYTASFLKGKHTTTTINADYICTSGPFAYIRNPLYMGHFIIWLSLCIAFNEWYGYAVFAVYYISVYSILIPYEERFMAEKFGDDFAEYSAHARRFLPRLKPFISKTPVTPNFRLGIWSEKFYFLFLALYFVVLYILFVR